VLAVKQLARSLVKVSRNALSPGNALGLLGCVVFGLSGLAIVAADPARFSHNEAAHNATMARELLVGNYRHLLDMQHSPYCGGCTLVSVLGWLAFGALGVGYLAWKAVPVFFSCAILFTGFQLLRRTHGSAAGFAFLVLMFGVPALVLQLTLMGFANHFEVVLFVLLQLVAVDHLLAPAIGKPGTTRVPWLLWGLFTGLGFWFCYHSLFALPPMAVVVGLAVGLGIAIRRVPLFVVGVAMGMLPFALFLAATDLNPFERVLPNAMADTSAVTPSMRLRKLLDVSLISRVDELHFLPWRGPISALGAPTISAVWAGCLAGVVLLPWSREPGTRLRAALPFAALAAAMGAYVWSPFAIPPTASWSSPPIDLRYLAPTALLLMLSAAAGIGCLWRMGTAGRAVACALLIVAAAPGIAVRMAWMHGVERQVRLTVPAAEDFTPYDYREWRGPAVTRLTRADLIAVESADWISTVNHARVIGLSYGSWFDTADAGDAPDLVAEIDALRGPGLSDLEIPAVFHGIGLAAATIESGRGTPGAFLPRIVELLEATGGAQRRSLAVGYWSNNHRIYESLGRPPPIGRDEIDEALAWPLSAADCALCPAVAPAVFVHADPDAISSLYDLVAGGEDTLPEEPVQRSAILEGIGARYGYDHGFREDQVEIHLRKLPPDDRVAFSRGFAIGRARLWAVDVTWGVPPEKVP